MPDIQELIDAFLAADGFAVVGASNDHAKYGAKVLNCYWQHGRTAFAVNPNQANVLGQPAYARLQDLPRPVVAASIITPPEVTERIVEDAVAAGVTMLWMQPGAESERAIARAEELGIALIAGGPCVLVALGYRDVWES